MVAVFRVTFVLIIILKIVKTSTNAVGYVGPACVAVEDLLYLHGIYSRRLTPEEVLAFKKYQNTLSLLKQLKDAVSKGATLLNNGSISLPTPVIPNFCEGFGDDVEVVLDGCIVRQNYVFIDNRLTRQLNNVERQKVLLVLESFHTQSYRMKRDSQNTTVSPIPITPASPQNPVTSDEPVGTTTAAPISAELKELLSKYFHVNANVTDRFLPVVQYSPVVNHLLNRPQLKQFQLNHEDVQDEVQKQRIREFIQDHIMKYQSRGQTATTTTTEIPHLMIENLMGPQAPLPSDPYVMQLLQQIQYNRQMELYQQQLQQHAAANRPLNPKTPRFPGAAPMKPGDTLEIGDQTYIAVPLSAHGGETVGLVPLSRTSTHTVTMLPPMRPWMRNGAPATPHQEQIRYHPGKRRPQYLQVATHVNGVPLPHEICGVVAPSP